MITFIVVFEGYEGDSLGEPPLVIVAEDSKKARKILTTWARARRQKTFYDDATLTEAVLLT